MNAKINQLTNLGELVEGLTNLVESQAEAENYQPCMRLHAKKKKNRAVETIVRSLSNNRTRAARRNVVRLQRHFTAYFA